MGAEGVGGRPVSLAAKDKGNPSPLQASYIPLRLPCASPTAPYG